MVITVTSDYINNLMTKLRRVALCETT